MTSEVGANATALPDSRATGRAVPYFQPAGSFSDGSNIRALSFGPCG